MRIYPLGDGTMTVKAARRLLVAATLALALVAAAIIAFGGPDKSTVVTSPRPSSPGSPSPAASPTSVPSASPDATTSPPPSRASGPLGAANDAVIVRVVGNPERPDAFEVSLVTLDAGAFETQLQPREIARLPASAIPEGYTLNSPAASYGIDGWLGLDLIEVATLDRSILVFDLRAPDNPPWLVPGLIVGASWGPGSVLAVNGEGEIQLYGPDGQTVESVAVPDGVLVHDTDLQPFAPPTWLADGSGFLAWRRDPELQIGRLDSSVVFAPADEPPAVFQSTGRERRWAADGAELSVDCPTDGGPAGCSVISGANSRRAAVWYTETSGDGVIQDYSWDAEGDGMWFLLERVTGEGPVAYAVAHADAPGQLTDVAVTSSLDPPSDGGFEILGIQDAAPIADGRHVLVGAQASTVQAAVSGDGSIATLEPGAWFAGWAGDQEPYPAR